MTSKNTFTSIIFPIYKYSLKKTFLNMIVSQDAYKYDDIKKYICEHKWTLMINDEGSRKDIKCLEAVLKNAFCIFSGNTKTRIERYCSQ